jgi:hypothetical protein
MRGAVFRTSRSKEGISMIRSLAALVLASAVACADSEPPDDRARFPNEETRGAPVIIEATPTAIKAAFADRGKVVLTFTGYSGSGYEDDDAMLARVRSVLEGYDPASTLVNIGGTIDGIGAAYEVASAMGFETTGVVSSQARASEATFSPFVDRVYVVPDEQWGGVVEATGRLSPTSEAMVAVSYVMVAIGGGGVTRDELSAARGGGKDVRFFSADLNHERALERARDRGEPPPDDFRGEAHAVFGESGGGGS